MVQHVGAEDQSASDEEELVLGVVVLTNPGNKGKFGQTNFINVCQHGLASIYVPCRKLPHLKE